MIDLSPRTAALRAAALVPLAALAALFACGGRSDLGIDTPLGGVPAPAGDDAGAGADGRAPRDAALLPDGAVPLCDDGGPGELSYLLDAPGVIYRYDPILGRATGVGAPSCGNPSIPWTGTFGRTTAYIVYTDWTLYAVDLATLACTRTPFRAGQLGLDSEFGVAISNGAGGERLFVYGLPTGSASPILAVSDLTSFTLTKVGDVLPRPPAAGGFPVNLTADGTGHLFAYAANGFVQELDTASGAVLRALQTGLPTTSTWASFTRGAEVFLVAGPRVVGYDLAARKVLSTGDAGMFPVGGGTVTTCPSR
jgi:hypothetical protein